MILSSVYMTLLLLRNNLIPLHQSSNLDWSLSNHPGSSTMFFSNPVCTFPLFATVSGTGTADISSIVVCSYSSEASSVICKDPSHSNNASILFILLELVLVLSS